MRRPIFRADRERALALLRRAPVVHLATTTPEGAPVLRALDAVVLGEAIYFHGARAGEKARCMGRPAVVSAEELVVHLPSWMVHPTAASAASTLYRSVQVHGTVVEVTDPAEKVRALEALVARWQPEGRYTPVDAGDPAQRGELAGTLVFKVAFDRVDGKEKLGQNRAPAEVQRILEGLWERGAPGDVAAIEAIRAACPAVPAPPFLEAGALTLHVQLGEEDVEGVAALLAGEYWWQGQRIERLGPAHLASSAWVGARDGDGRVVASARAVSDGRAAWIYDLVVAERERGRGLGSRVLALLLEHPAVRSCETVRLHTRDAEGLYRRHGFKDPEPLPAGKHALVLHRR